MAKHRKVTACGTFGYRTLDEALKKARTRVERGETVVLRFQGGKYSSYSADAYRVATTDRVVGVHVSTD